jgi:hypothetical protein
MSEWRSDIFTGVDTDATEYSFASDWRTHRITNHIDFTRRCILNDGEQ